MNFNSYAKRFDIGASVGQYYEEFSISWKTPLAFLKKRTIWFLKQHFPHRA